MTPSEQLSWIMDSLPYVAPELVLSGGILLLIVGSMVASQSRRTAYFVTLILLATSMAVVLLHWPARPVSLFSNMLRLDDFSAILKVMICAGGLLTLLMAGVKEQGWEFHMLLLSVVTGACFLVMSSNLVIVVLALELVSISSYVLTAGFEPVKARAESAWKFFLFGSASTAFMIFGMSYLYGLSGTLDFSSSVFVDQLIKQESPFVLIGGLMTLSGFLFKMTAVPFHFWAPDVYESTPTPLVAFFSVVPKLAGLGILIKFSLVINLFGQSGTNWPAILALAGIASILVGNLAALAQTDAKRMMAYSSIAQAGFLILSASTFSIEGVRIAIFYAAVYAIANFLAFRMILQGERALQSADVRAFAGFGRRAVLQVFFGLCALISLAGLPPTAGFMAKLFVFSSLWEKYRESGEILFAVVFAVGLLNTVISLFFYLKIPYFAYMKDVPSEFHAEKIHPANNLLGFVLVTLLLLLFFFPGVLMGWVNKVNFVL